MMCFARVGGAEFILLCASSVFSASAAVRCLSIYRAAILACVRREVKVKTGECDCVSLP